MNATERLIGLYYQLHLKCFTATDVKIPEGNNRQLDMLAYVLAYGLSPARAYHVEVSVTPIPGFQPTPASLAVQFREKFLINPQSRMDDAYGLFNLPPQLVQRVFCCWVRPDAAAMELIIQAFAAETGIHVELLSLRDEVFPALMKLVGTSNYEDDILRTLSLIKQWHQQVPQANLEL